MSPTATGTATAITARTALRAAAVVSAALLALAACSSGSGDGSGSGGKASGSAAGGGSGTRVTVTETDYALKLSRSSFTPGTYTFVADNAGKVTHALSVDGPGVRDAKTGDVQGGQESTVTVTLKKGTYELYCPIPGHKQLGMDTRIQVG
ncbi:plastocyanin/azurin family copper-binding protein [Streptomyces sp. 7R007]